MKKLTTLLCLFVFCATAIFSQSNSKPTNTSKKANKRPEKTPSSTPPIIKNAPKIANGETGEAIGTDDEIIKVDTELVTLPVRVLDRNGRFVAGLKKKDFRIFEDKVNQEVAYFSNEQKPFTVALILDMSYSSTFKINEIQQAALTFITQLRPDDKVMIISFDMELYIHCEPTNDRDIIKRAIIRTKIGSGTSLYDAVDFAINKRFRKISGRKAIVLFTDGVDTTSNKAHDLDNLRDASELESLIYPIRYDTFADVKAIESGRVIIKDTGTITTPPIGGGGVPTGKTKSPLPFPIPTGTIGTGKPRRGIPGSRSGTTREEYVFAAKYLDQMAGRTGGRVYEANSISRLTRAFSKIASELREFYSLGYYPSNTKRNGKPRKIKVRVNRKKVAVRTRKSYVPGKKKAKK